MQYIELSHQIADGMPVFPGLEPPRITAFLSHEQSRPHYEGEAEFYLSKVEMVGNTATYLDSPFHRYRDGRDLSEIPFVDVADLFGKGVRRARAVGEDLLSKELPSELNDHRRDQAAGFAQRSGSRRTRLSTAGSSRVRSRGT